MTTQDNYVPIVYQGNGTTTDFDFSFRIISKTNTLVYLQDTSGIQTKQTLDSDYTVVLNNLGQNGGTIKFITAPTSVLKVVIGRSLVAEQPSPFKTSSEFPSITIENSFDRNNLLIQDLLEKANRNIIFPIGSGFDSKLTSIVADTVIGVDSAGTKLELYSFTNIPVTEASLYGKELVKKTNSLEARNWLELSQNGIFEWQTIITYPQNSYCLYLGVLYKSLQASNLNKNPTTETSWWKNLGINDATITTKGVNYLNINDWTGLIPSNNIATPNTKIDVTAGKVPDSLGATLLELSSGTLDITLSTDWAAGTVPGLTSISIYIFAIASGLKLDVNSGGSNITVAKRLIGSVSTDGSSNILLYSYKSYSQNNESLASWMTPDYLAGVSISTTTGNTYVVPADGFIFVVVAASATSFVQLNNGANTLILCDPDTFTGTSNNILVKKNTSIYVSSRINGTITFYPFLGN